MANNWVKWLCECAKHILKYYFVLIMYIEYGMLNIENKDMPVYIENIYNIYLQDNILYLQDEWILYPPQIISNIYLFKGE